MGTFNHYAVLAAVHTVLQADTELMQRVSGVFDFVPAKTAYPYLRIGEVRVTDVSTQTGAMQRVEWVMHCHSRDKGGKEVQDILQRVHALLHDAPPEMVGTLCIDMRAEGSDIRLERDASYHGRMRLVAIIEPKEDGQ